MNSQEPEGAPKPEMLEKAKAIITDFEVYLSVWPEIARCSFFKHERDKLASLIAAALRASEAAVEEIRSQRDEAVRITEQAMKDRESLTKERDALKAKYLRVREAVRNTNRSLRERRYEQTRKRFAWLIGQTERLVSEVSKGHPSDYMWVPRTALEAARAEAIEQTSKAESWEQEYNLERLRGVEARAEATKAEPLCPVCSKPYVEGKFIHRGLSGGNPDDWRYGWCCSDGPSSPTPPTSPLGTCDRDKTPHALRIDEYEGDPCLFWKPLQPGDCQGHPCDLCGGMKHYCPRACSHPVPSPEPPREEPD